MPETIGLNPPRHDHVDQGVIETPAQPLAPNSSAVGDQPPPAVGPAENPYTGPARPGVQDVNRAINAARLLVKQAARKAARDAARTVIVAQVATSLGAALHKVIAPGNNYGPPHFVDEGVQVMKDGYGQAYSTGVMDAADDMDWSDDNLDQGAITQVQRSPDPSFKNFAMIAGMVGAVRALQGHDAITTGAEAQRPFLTGLLQDAMTTQDPASLGWRFSLYGGTIIPFYEQGYGAMGAAEGRVAVWHTMGDDRVCGYCEGRDGETYPEDEVGLYPGDGDFGEACDGGPNCRCWFEWVYPGEAMPVAASVQVELQKFYEED